MSVDTLQPEFVTSVPDELEEGVLYISIPFRTSIHLCACGCRNKVVMPIRPGAWHLTYDGETASMSPSVGNWSLPCRSHYWIRRSTIEWAASWGHERASRARRPSNDRPEPSGDLHDETVAPLSLWRRILRLLGQRGLSAQRSKRR